MHNGKQKAASLAFWSIVVALGVLGLKAFAWRITGSVALYSDALESIVNVIAAAAAFWAIQISHKPADSDHQHGHHKAEYFSAVLEGVLIVLAALMIVAAAWEALLRPQPLQQPWEGLAVNGFASLINAVWAFILIRTGRAERSPALVADGQHIMTDVVTSIGVIVGLIAVVFTGYGVLDPLLAILVALNILYQGWRVIGGSLSGLMDKAVPLEDNMHIRDIISANSKGALEVHDLKTRTAGSRHLHRVPPDRRRRNGGAREPRHLRPHRGRAEGRNPFGARPYPCRAGRRGKAAAGHCRGAVRLTAFGANAPERKKR